MTPLAPAAGACEGPLSAAAPAALTPTPAALPCSPCCCWAGGATARLAAAGVLPAVTAAPGGWVPAVAATVAGAAAARFCCGRPRAAPWVRLPRLLRCAGARRLRLRAALVRPPPLERALPALRAVRLPCVRAPCGARDFGRLRGCAGASSTMSSLSASLPRSRSSLLLPLAAPASCTHAQGKAWEPHVPVTSSTLLSIALRVCVRLSALEW